jgi:hypothetical protein
MGMRPNYCPPAFRRALPVLRHIGASPSGKAADFDSAMRRFESSRPSHAFHELADFAACGAEPRIRRAFAGVEIGDRQNRACLGGFVCSVSNADFPISGIARQGAGETGLLFLETGSHSDGYGGPRRRGALAVARLNWGSRRTGQSRPSCSSCSVQVSGRLRASRVTVRSGGARCSAMACNGGAPRPIAASPA